MRTLASSRRFSIARALSLNSSDDPELCLALAEWHARETDPTVRGEVQRTLTSFQQRHSSNPPTTERPR